MTRAHTDRSERRAPIAGQGFGADVPVAGFYRMSLVRGGVKVGIRIWFGPPLDPIDGSELDRSHRWQATANGKYISLERVWPKCGDDPVDQAEHDYLAGLEAWGKAHAPTSPQANPNQPVNMLTAPLPF